MENIIITKEEHGFTVKQGDKWTDMLTFDEMLGLVAALTMPENRPCVNWMWTKERHEWFNRGLKINGFNNINQNNNERENKDLPILPRRERKTESN